MTYSFMVLQGKSNYVRCQTQPHSHLVCACESWHQNITKHREACMQYNKLNHLWAYSLHNPHMYICVSLNQVGKREIYTRTWKEDPRNLIGLPWCDFSLMIPQSPTEIQMPNLGRVTDAMEKDQVTSYRHLSLPREAAQVLLIGLEFWGPRLDESEGMPIRNKIWDQFPFPSTTVSTPLTPALSKSFYTLISHCASRFVVLI